MQLDSYSFAFPSDHTGEAKRVLLPLIDLINHHGDPNVELRRDKDSSSYVVIALRPIRCCAKPVILHSLLQDLQIRAFSRTWSATETVCPSQCLLAIPGRFQKTVLLGIIALFHIFIMSSECNLLEAQHSACPTDADSVDAALETHIVQGQPSSCRSIHDKNFPCPSTSHGFWIMSWGLWQARRGGRPQVQLEHRAQRQVAARLLLCAGARPAAAVRAGPAGRQCLGRPRGGLQ